jgi:hypothetical protein
LGRMIMRRSPDAFSLLEVSTGFPVFPAIAISVYQKACQQLRLTDCPYQQRTISRQLV